MFFSKDKDKIVDKKKELLGRDDPLNEKLLEISRPANPSQ